MMTNANNTTLYTGVTNDLIRRVWEHKHNVNDGFTKEYILHKLVYFEVYNNPTDAIAREKFFKKAFKNYKRSLVNKFNPDWVDLYDRFVKDF